MISIPMASSDSSDDSISPLEDTVTCILHSSSSSSVDSVNGMDISKTNETSFLAAKSPKVLDRIQTLSTGGTGKVYSSTSLKKDWGIKCRGPTSVVCDVCIVSHKRPVTLLTFVQDLEDEDEVIKYNTKVARYLLTAVRERLYGNFSLVYGVMGPTLCDSDELFRKEIQCLDEDAKICSVPGWLHMNTDRCKQLVEFIDKMFVSRDSLSVISTSTFCVTNIAEEYRSNGFPITGKTSESLCEDSSHGEKTIADAVAINKPNLSSSVEIPTASSVRSEQFVYQESVNEEIVNSDDKTTKPEIRNVKHCRTFEMQVSQDSLFEGQVVSSKPTVNTPSPISTIGFGETPFSLRAQMSHVQSELSDLKNRMSRLEMSTLRSSSPKPFKPGGCKSFKRRKELKQQASSELPNETDREKNLTDQEKHRRQSDPQLAKPKVNRFHSLG